MNEHRKVAEQSGYVVRGFAPSAEAAKVLASEGKLEAQTVAALLTAPVQKANTRELWIVDEAGLLSARDTAKLLERAEETKARVMFVGDTRQLSSVEAGNPFKLMQEKLMRRAFCWRAINGGWSCASRYLTNDRSFIHAQQQKSSLKTTCYLSLKIAKLLRLILKISRHMPML